MDDGGSIQLNTSRSEPRVAHSAASAAARLERIERRMSAAGDEAELVQPAAHDRSVVAVQVEELDTLIAQRGNGAQRPLEIAGSILAHGVEHQADTRHATSNPLAVPGRNRSTRELAS